jgi:hypothetical protein
MEKSLMEVMKALGGALVRVVALVTGVWAILGVVSGGEAPAPITLQRPVAGASAHAYFDALVARPEKAKAYSLRSQAQLDSLVGSGPSEFFKYTWPTDTYARPQDAAKLVKPPRKDFSKWFPTRTFGDNGDENIPGPQTLRIPLGISSGTVLITWDVYWGEEFQTNAGWDNNPVNAWKTFFLYAGVGTGGTEGQWLGHDHIGMARGTPGLVSKHHEGIGSKLVTRARGMITRDPLEPTGAAAEKFRTFGTYYNRWTRYWLEYRMNVPGSEFTEWSANYLGGGTPLDGNWDMATLWIADEQRNARRVFYRVPSGRRATDTMLANFRFSWDTSTTNLAGGGLTGPVIAYVRNLVVLKDAVVDDTGSEAPTGPKPRPPTNVRIVPPPGM